MQHLCIANELIPRNRQLLIVSPKYKILGFAGERWRLFASICTDVFFKICMQP